MRPWQAPAAARIMQLGTSAAAGPHSRLQLIAVTVSSRVPASEQPATEPAPSTVVPVLMQGMMELNRKRPADPIEFLCAFLQQHNPKKQQKTN